MALAMILSASCCDLNQDRGTGGSLGKWNRRRMMKQARNQQKPLARKAGLVIQELPDEVLVYDLERDRAHCLNQTAAFVWQRCDGRTSTGEIARSLGQEVNAAVDEKVVWFAIDQLGRNHLMATL